MKILIVDDHPLFLDGISPLLEKLDANVELLTAQTSEIALELLDLHQDLDLVLLDLHLPDTDGLSLLRSISEYPIETPVVMLTASTRYVDMHNALSGGAKGYICKSSASPIVLNALSLVLAGGVYIPPEMVQGNKMDLSQTPIDSNPDNPANNPIHLTPRQTEVLDLLVDGHGRSNKEIANMIGCSEATIKVHVTALLKAMNVSNRNQLLFASEKLGIIPKKRRNTDNPSVF